MRIVRSPFPSDRSTAAGYHLRSCRHIDAHRTQQTTQYSAFEDHRLQKLHIERR